VGGLDWSRCLYLLSELPVLYKGTSTSQLTEYAELGHARINNDGGVVWNSYVCVPQRFIATAAFGTELDGKINTVRAFRDRYLMSTASGIAFVTAYHRYSPPVADYIAERDWLRAFVRTQLLPVIGLVSVFVWAYPYLVVGP